jgi:hypothetical protein
VCAGSCPERGVAGDGLTTTISGMGRIGQINMAPNPTTGSSLKAAMSIVTSANKSGLWRAGATPDLSKPLMFLYAADERFARSTSKTRKRGNTLLRGVVYRVT